MAQTDRQFAAAHRAWEASWINGPDWDDNGRDENLGCPLCEGETNERAWPCSNCEDACKNCGTPNTPKDAQGLCEECQGGQP